MRRQLTMTLTAAAVGCLAFLGGIEAQEEGPMNTERPTFRYGLRYDPMRFVEEGDSLQAALVRRHVFHSPRRGDQKVLRKRIKEILAEQREDGLLADRGHGHASRLAELADCGADPGAPRVKKAIEATLRGDPAKDNEIWVRDLRGLCLFGITDHANMKRSLQLVLDREEEWNGPYKICPWGQAFYLRALWPAREVLDTTDVCRRTLRWMLDGLNEAGCVSYKDPWGLVWGAGVIDLPEAKQLIERLVPTILRGQRPDGSWGTGEPYDAWSRASVKVYEALVRHGLLDELRKLPPLPPDWQIARQIPAPQGDLSTLTYDGERLWTLDREGSEAIAISPEDGAVVKKLKVPFDEAFGVGWWDGGLGVTQQKPKRLVKLDANTGEIAREVPLDKLEWVHGFAAVNGEIWLSDAWMGCIARMDPDKPDEVHLLGVGGPNPVSLTEADGGVWHIDAFSPCIIKSDPEGKLLDYGEKPFDGECDGIAWDGERLWALDNAGKRLCVIERATAATNAGKEDRPTMSASTATKEIDGLRWKGRWMSNMGCLKPCLQHLGREVSWPWLYGASGWAFVLNIHEELCPSGWHCAEFPQGSLAKNTGAAMDWFSVGPHEFPSDEDRPGRQKGVWDKTRAALDKGQPCIGYDLEIGDYYVVYGYDEAGYHYSGPRCDAGKGPLKWQDLGVTGQVGLICMGAVELAEPPDDTTVVREALQFAVEHAKKRPKPDDVYHAGLAAYDQWIGALRAGHVNGWGPVYNAACYLECRRQAVGFLTEARERLDGDLGPLFDEAIGHYEAVAGSLEKLARAFPTEGGHEHEPDEAAVKQGIAALRAAKKAEAKGVKALARLAAAIPEPETAPED